MSISETFRQWLIQPILDHIDQKEKQLMSALDDKTAAIKAAVAQLGTDLATAVADIKANSGSGAPTAAQLQALDDIATQLQGLDTTVKAEDPGAPPAA